MKLKILPSAGQEILLMVTCKKFNSALRYAMTKFNRLTGWDLLSWKQRRYSYSFNLSASLDRAICVLSQDYLTRGTVLPKEHPLTYSFTKCVRSEIRKNGDIYEICLPVILPEWGNPIRCETIPIEILNKEQEAFVLNLIYEEKEKELLGEVTIRDGDWYLDVREYVEPKFNLLQKVKGVKDFLLPHK